MKAENSKISNLPGFRLYIFKVATSNQKQEHDTHSQISYAAENLKEYLLNVEWAVP